MFEKIPHDILQIILEYNGKYMNKISKTDMRYKILKNIKSIEKIFYKYFIVYQI